MLIHISDASKVKAIRDLWFIGDNFVNETYHALQEMLRDAKADRKDGPYVYEMYNVHCFTSKPASLTRSIPARLVQTVSSRCLMNHTTSPRFIIIIPDWDILKYIDHFTFGVEKVVSEIIDWMTINITRAIEAKKDQLYKIKPGSITTTEPKIVWVKMLQRLRSFEKILTVRAKYNSVLESMIAEQHHHFIIDPNPILRNTAYFMRNNDLNGDGRILFWKEIDECIQLFDRKKLELQPRRGGNNNKTTAKTDSAAQLHFKLPPPMPVQNDHRRKVTETLFRGDNHKRYPDKYQNYKNH